MLCAFLTLEERGDYVIDDEYAIEPMAEMGWQISTVSWRQTTRAWSDFDVVIIRSTWDYWYDVPAFISTMEDINRQTRLANPLNVVKWNLEKTYLRDLADKHGIGIVPTCWAAGLHVDSFPRYQEELGTEELVVKPVIGGSGDDAFRVSPTDSQEYRQLIASRFRDRKCMVQPFMHHVVGEGEYSLFYFNGELSHAISKQPAKNEFRSQEERGASIRSCEPEKALLRRGKQAINALGEVPLYARIDLIRNDADEFLLMELELIEPSLYLRMAPDIAGRFAAAIDHWVKGH